MSFTKSSVWVVFFASLILLSSFVFAVHIVRFVPGHHSSLTAGNVTEDVTFAFNITINNTDTLTTANITEVNITLPGGFLYIAGTNYTGNLTASSGHVLVNTSTLVSFRGVGVLVGNLSNISLVFNATPSTPGWYNFTILTANATHAFQHNLSVFVNDTTLPSSIEFASPIETNGTDYTRQNIDFNVSVLDNGNWTVILEVFNSTHNRVNFSNSAIGALSHWVNFTSMAEGRYYINATINDSSNLKNSTTITRVIDIDRTGPSASMTCTPSSVYTGDTVTCTCTATDTLDASPSLSYTVNPSTSLTGDRSTTCTATDDAGNSGSATVTYTVSEAGTGGGSGGSGSSTSTVSWANTIPLADKNLADKGAVSRELGSRQRVSIKVNNEVHHVGVVSLTASNAEIEVASTPQRVTMSIGESKKFDTNADGYYDVKVTLVSIANAKANVMVESINEAVPAGTTTTDDTGSSTTSESDSILSSSSSSSTWIWVLVIAVVIVAVVFFVMKRKR